MIGMELLHILHKYHRRAESIRMRIRVTPEYRRPWDLQRLAKLLIRQVRLQHRASETSFDGPQQPPVSSERTEEQLS